NWQGRGPYQCWWQGQSDLHEAHDDDRKRPSPIEDFRREDLGAVIGSSCRYGFLLKEDAVAWFEGWFERLAEAGFRLCEVEAKEIVAFGTTQVAFLPAALDADSEF